MTPRFTITAFYHFFSIAEADLERVQADLIAKGEELKMRGLVLVATEGLNGTVSGSAESIAAWKEYLNEVNEGITFKDSSANDQPFKRWFVKIRREIVGLGDETVLPDGKHNHISPTEWNRMMEEEDVVIIDTRNDYEVDIGKFKGAIDPKIHTFKEFPEWVKYSEIPKDKKVMMYCTGGIRCEKALLEMERQGYENVYQLDGGILKYLEEYPNEQYEGECFVFDHRTSVDQNLQPSTKYGLCPHTGDPADVHITCEFCGTETRVAKHASEHQKRVCSKDCAHRLILKEKKVATK